MSKAITAIMFLLLFAFGNLQLHAQIINSKHTDTANSIQTTEETAAQETIENQPELEFYKNELTLPADSVKKFKTDKKLHEARMLDSLLKDYEQKQALYNANNLNKISWLARLLTSPITKYFFWMLAGLFIIFVIYKLFISEGFFRLQSSSRKTLVQQPEMATNTTTPNYLLLIKQAEVDTNFRLATRYQYLHLLQKLDAASLISYLPHKTNSAYQRELAGKNHGEVFTNLTKNYEYCWYGKFELDEATYSKLAERFFKLNKQL